ncbi:MAG: ABC transporter ATP-binding protein, partial [Tissierellia bacterium]|nr:ABC transporter ATP-binding protein [Tissierellia bacterium]
MLKIANLSKKFGEFQVLEDININAEKSSIYGLVGSNGCG